MAEEDGGGAAAFGLVLGVAGEVGECGDGAGAGVVVLELGELEGDLVVEGELGVDGGVGGELEDFAVVEAEACDEGLEVEVVLDEGVEEGGDVEGAVGHGCWSRSAGRGKCESGGCVAWKCGVVRTGAEVRARGGVWVWCILGAWPGGP